MLPKQPVFCFFRQGLALTVLWLVAGCLNSAMNQTGRVVKNAPGLLIPTFNSWQTVLRQIASIAQKTQADGRAEPN
jgi:hypothetical protein